MEWDCEYRKQIWKEKETGKYVSYTWHHNLKTKQLELVLKDAHEAGRHMGAGSVMTIIQDMFK